MNKETIESLLIQVTGPDVTVQEVRPIGGGNTSRAFGVKSSKGNFFIKTNRAGLVDMFEKEVRNLELLRRAVPQNTPEVVGYGTVDHISYFILKLIEPGKRVPDFWEDFGRTLAEVHKVHSTSFGLEYDNYIGALPQSNKQHTNWVDFFVEERIWPQARKAEKVLGTEIISMIDKLSVRLPDLLTQSKPALLHGDLWSGNFTLNQKGTVCFVDPASYFGNREIEIAFTKLFGGFEDEFYEAYKEVLPLDKGFFDTRADIYNLYPLLVHVNLFGGWYIASVRETLKRFV
ncbi:MAG: fructosamine kinase family protein [Cytophaga sp.]|uniref:fructosamine kinase family protein n=1 Tax=Cytophaga sp. TaxID=29535 RepID=UPI003F8142B9